MDDAPKQKPKKQPPRGRNGGRPPGAPNKSSQLTEEDWAIIRRFEVVDKSAKEQMAELSRRYGALAEFFKNDAIKYDYFAWRQFCVARELATYQSPRIAPIGLKELIEDLSLLDEKDLDELERIKRKAARLLDDQRGEIALKPANEPVS